MIWDVALNILAPDDWVVFVRFEELRNVRSPRIKMIKFLLAKYGGEMSLNGCDSSRSDVVAEDPQRRDGLVTMSAFEGVMKKKAYWVIYGITVSNLCRKCRIDDIIRFLNGIHIGVCPRGLRLCNLLHHITDELVAEAWPNVRREILESRVDSDPSLNPWEEEHRRRVILKLEGRLLDRWWEMGDTNDLHSRCTKTTQKPSKLGLSAVFQGGVGAAGRGLQTGVGPYHRATRLLIASHPQDRWHGDLPLTRTRTDQLLVFASPWRFVVSTGWGSRATEDNLLGGGVNRRLLAFATN